MQLKHDTDTFIVAANELAIRFIQSIATCLHQSSDVNFDLANAEAANSDLLFEICFKGAIEFEEQSGIEADGSKYTPRVAFDTTRFGDEEIILIGAGSVHGMIDDPQLSEGVERARRWVLERSKDD